MAATDIVSIVIAPLTDIAKLLSTQIGYIFYYRRNVHNLRNQVEKLGHMRNDVNGLVEVALMRGEKIKEVVQEWVKGVGEMEREMRRIDDEFNQNKYFMGWCPNCSSRYGLGKKAMKKMEAVNELERDGNFNNIVSYPSPLPGIESLPIGDFEAFESTRLHMKQVLDALKDENINRIGVYGMGGVGKTTLVKQVIKQVKRENICNKILMVTISQNQNIKKIQGELAENLGMKLEEESESVRARKLMERLKEEKTVLVILDDLWEELVLSNVCIPYGEDHKGCKIVITSRSLKVCTAMECQTNFEVEILSDQDSWSLFRKKAGDVVDLPSLKDVAKNVVKECGGLPLAIVTLGGALRNEGDQRVWKDALMQMKRSSPSNIEGMHEKVYSSLMLSYKYIKNEEAKLLFLFCCLFEEDYEIDRELLLIYGMGEGFFSNVYTLEEARGRLHVLVGKLISSSLLLHGKEEQYVKMHDMVRDVAISIASNDDYGFIVKSGTKLNEWPEGENMKQCKRISLINAKIGALSSTTECPKLRTLILKDNLTLREIHDTFFEGMKSLAILDLSRTSISSLPTSICCLTNLITLNLDGCYNLQVLSLQGLEKLEVVILKETSIRELPAEIDKLSNLKLLNLSQTPLGTIPRNKISNLRHLEELDMLHTFIDASLAEVIASLPALRVLRIWVKNAEFLSKEISCQWKNLREFSICVAENFPWDWLSMVRRRSMRLNILSPISDWVKELLKITEYLALVHCDFDDLNKVSYGLLQIGPFTNLRVLLLSECRNSTSILHSDLLLGLENLVELVVRHCEELKEVFHYEGPTTEGHALLSNLENVRVFDCGSLRSVLSPTLARHIHRLDNLLIVYCPNMENIISVEEIELPHLRSTPIFQNLRKLDIRQCDKLKNIFSWSLACGLTKLEELHVDGCDGMEEIIAEEGMVVNKVVLPKLTLLKLQSLPKLRSFYQGGVLELPSLVSIDVLGCPKLKMFPLEPGSAPNLKTIKATKEWFEGLEVEDESYKSHLQSLLHVSSSGVLALLSCNLYTQSKTNTYPCKTQTSWGEEYVEEENWAKE